LAYEKRGAASSSFGKGIIMVKTKSGKLRESLKAGNEKNTSKEKKTKPKEYPRSYRLDPEVMETLKSTLDRINEVAPKKVSEARLVKALIIISKEIKEERIIKALKEVW
jgi:hypothetical protein